MWEDSTDAHAPLSHDFPCPYCGHAGHYYLPCDRECDCQALVHADS